MLKYDAHLQNIILIYESSTTEARKEGFIPMIIFYGDTYPWKDKNTNPIHQSRVWGFTNYVIYPVIHDGGNILKW